jgi:acyl-coenzyme A thioesterase PaaI-like protein
VVEIRLEPEGGPVRMAGPTVTVERMTPADAVVEFWTDVEGEQPDQALLGLLHGAVDAALGDAS